MVDRAVLSGAVGNDEDLGAALLQDELCRPRPCMLEGKRVLGFEKLPDLTQPVFRRRRHDAVRVRPQLSHSGILVPGTPPGNTTSGLDLADEFPTVALRG